MAPCATCSIRCIARQVSGNETTLRLRMDVPPQIAPRWVTVSLSVEFDCLGRAVAFMLLRQLG